MQGQLLIMPAQPVDEIVHFDVTRHPRGEAGKGLFGRRFMRLMTHITIDPRGVDANMEFAP